MVPRAIAQLRYGKGLGLLCVLPCILLGGCTFPEYRYELSASDGGSGAAVGGASVGSAGTSSGGTSAGLGGGASQAGGSPQGGAPQGGAPQGGAPQGGAAGTAGVGGVSGSAAGGASSGCVPGPDDVVCDGLDQACQPVEIDAACPQGCTGVTEGGHEYMSCETSLDFAHAELRCNAQGMHLIHVHNGTENARLMALANAIGSYVWIGGSNQLDQTSFTWLDDGSAFYTNSAPVTGVYQNFDAGQPNANPARQCVQVHDSTGLWSNVQCSDTMQFVCSR